MRAEANAEMTLDEAITHLDETLDDPKHEWGCAVCRTEHEQLRAWLVELRDLRERDTQPAKDGEAAVEVAGQRTLSAVREVRNSSEAKGLSMNTRDKIMFVFGYVYRSAQEIQEAGSFTDLSTMELAKLLLDSVLKDRGY